ncbi:MAG: DUF3180 domain-containing protein [Rothia sp. (in: high G+C Gram-positive bacteria)]|nr:DUF3180 domain-containing protein [Rothia sp. (in: high G+C Gram-positive bacteria)]
MNLRYRALALTLAGGAAAGAFVNLLSVQSGGAELSLPWLVLPVALLLGGAALYLARQVRKFSKRQTRDQAGNMNPLLAARVAVYAQALALTGALLSGWQLAIFVFQLGLLASRPALSPLVQSGAVLVAGIFMLVAGVCAENMCKIPPGDDEDGGHPGLGETSPQPGTLAKKVSRP